MYDYKIQVENIKCGGCENSIKSALKNKYKLDEVLIDNESGIIEVRASHEFDEGKIADTLAKMGYPKIGEGNNLQKAKSYVSCMIGRIKPEN